VTVLGWPAFDNKTGNPYTRLLYEAVERRGVSVADVSTARVLRGTADVLHVHWPEDALTYRSPVTAAAYVALELALMAAARVRGAALVWTIHDLTPHEAPHPGLAPLFWRGFLPMVDGYTTLTAHAAAAARARFPRLAARPGAVIPHGHYRPAYPAPTSRRRARAHWGLPPDGPVAAYVGRIRPYKNVPALLAAFRQMDGDARLLVAGAPRTPALGDRVARAAAQDPRVRTCLRFVARAEMPFVLGAADLVVLPYEQVLHSGTALLALSFDRPVLVPRRGALPELQAEVGPEWVRTYEGRLTPATLRAALRWARTTDRPDRAPLADRDWGPLARDTVAFYRRVLRLAP
jgi:glycosyltransferase involved in cell wall biosynthesis